MVRPLIKFTPKLEDILDVGIAWSFPRRHIFIQSCPKTDCQQGKIKEFNAYNLDPYEEEQYTCEECQGLGFIYLVFEEEFLFASEESLQ